MRAYIILDLGFGDAGKGLLTDFLVRRTGAGLVVRYNGGAQAGHNVVTPDGRQHTFSQFGSGSFDPGVKTWLSRHVVVHPTALLVEGDLLVSKGLGDIYFRLRLSEQALVITPFHQAANRLRELTRADGCHGSCGVGVGEVVEDAHLYPDDCLCVGDLARPHVLRSRLERIRERLKRSLADLPQTDSEAPEWHIFEESDISERWIAAIGRFNALNLAAPDDQLADWLGKTDAVVFEGAQGALLDACAGFHPYTSWSDCTPAAAMELLQAAAPDVEIVRIGVMRSFMIRHGPGPLPTETEELRGFIREHNNFNPWQGAVRYGWFDALLARYALAFIGGVDLLMVTHMDLLDCLQQWRYSPGYRDFSELEELSISLKKSEGMLESFSPPDCADLDLRGRLTQALFRVRPTLEACKNTDTVVLEKMEELLDRPVNLVSHGPTADNVEGIEFIPR